MSGTYNGYEQLDKVDREIRVLRILPPRHALPDRDGDNISCTLEKVQLADANPYYALSYVWGPQTPGSTLSLNGQTVYIRSNLFKFLHVLRARFCRRPGESSSEPRSIRVWVDSLCIDQSNTDERNYQISLMGDIYRGADAVYAWLGDSQEKHASGMQHIEQIAQMRAQNRRWMDISKEYQASEDYVQSIASDVYWTRSWIKQEIMLARDVWIFSGSYLVNWKDLRFAANLRSQAVRNPTRRHSTPYAGRRQSQALLVAPGQAMNSLMDLRAAGSTNFALPELLAKFQGAQCQDARDRIYSILSLTNAETRRQIVVDYDRPVLQVLLENYPYWTGEVQDMLSEFPLYQVESFCSQLARMLPGEELDLLRISGEIRSTVKAKGLFTTSPLTEIETVFAIACMDDTRIMLPSEAHESCSWIMNMVVKMQARGQPVHRRTYMIYADVVPEEGDLLAHIGSRVLFCRSTASPDEMKSPADREILSIIGTGTELLQRSFGYRVDNRLSTQVLPHPCSWKARQLHDASFCTASNTRRGSSGHIKGSRQYPRGVNVLCNAAAMVTFLIESDKFEPSTLCSDCNKDSISVASQDYIDHQSVTQADLEDGWSPYHFGIQHKVLDPCRLCKTMGPSTFGLPHPGFDHLLPRECECKWSSPVI